MRVVPLRGHRTARLVVGKQGDWLQDYRQRQENGETTQHDMSTLDRKHRSLNDNQASISVRTSNSSGKNRNSSARLRNSTPLDPPVPDL